MKRILVVLLLVFCISSGFAREKSFESLGFHFSLPLMFENEVEYGIEVNSTMQSFCLGLNGLTLYSEKFGVYSYFDVVFPQKIKLKLSYAGQTEYGVVDRSSYYSFWGIDALLGFAIKVFQNEMNLFTISPGIHYEMLSAEAQDSVLTYIFGLGLNIQDYISLNEKVFLMLGANILYDFVGFGLYNGESNSVDSNTFCVSPNVGMIFRL